MTASSHQASARNASSARNIQRRHIVLVVFTAILAVAVISFAVAATIFVFAL